MLHPSSVLSEVIWNHRNSPEGLSLNMQTLSSNLDFFFFLHTFPESWPTWSKDPTTHGLVCCLSSIYFCRLILPTISTLFCILGGWIWTVSMSLWLSCGFIWLEAQARDHGLLSMRSLLAGPKHGPWQGAQVALSDLQQSLLPAIPSDLQMERIASSSYSQENALYLVISHILPLLCKW